MEKDFIEDPFIHLFETPLGYYCYDVNMNKILKIEDKIFDALSGKKCDEKTFWKIERLKSAGYLKSNRVKKSEHPDTWEIPYLVRNRLDTLSLQLTQNCNLRCNYCVYSDHYSNRSHRVKRMPEIVAKRGIDFLIDNSSDSQTLFLGFYGGEPLLEYNLLKKSIEYAEKKAKDKEFYFSITTNATLLTEEKVDYLVGHNIHILVSMDGPKEIHDSARRFADNRKGTYDEVSKNLNYIYQKYPDFFENNVSFNVVLHYEGYEKVRDFIGCHPYFKTTSVMTNFITESYAKETNVDDEYSREVKEAYEYDRFLRFAYELGKVSNISPTKLVESDFYKLVETFEALEKRYELPEVCHRSGPCIPGVQKLFLTCEGTFYPCERVNETCETTKIGDLEKGLDIEKIISLTNMERYSSEQCRRCWAYSLCTICLSGLDTSEGIDREILKSRCRSVRAHIDSELKDFCTLKDLGYQKIAELTGVSLFDLFYMETLEQKIYPLKIPIIFVGEMYRGLTPEDLTEEMAGVFRSQGYAVKVLDENALDPTVATAMGTLWQRNESSQRTALRLNKIAKKIELQQKYDLILVKIPGGIYKFSDRFTDGFGFQFKMAQEALNPDIILLDLPCENYSSKKFNQIEKRLRNLGIEADYFNVVGKSPLVEQSERDSKMAYLSLSEECVHDVVSRLNRPNVYSVSDSRKIRSLVCSMINQLASFDIEGVMEI